MRLSTLLARTLKADIRNRRDLTLYVLRISATCVILAVGFDVANQLVFFVGWASALRSWAISAVVALVISVPVSLAIARAYLDLYKAKVIVEAISLTDALTGLPNRRALFEFAESLPAVVALVIADIDRFKRVNDTYGHLVGDEVIRVVGHAMQAELGCLGQVGRLGGEEFALLSPETDTDALVARLWDFRDRIAAVPIAAGGTTVTVTISAGVARRAEGQSFADLFRAADRALYMAKASGRNRIVSAAQLEPDDASAALHADDRTDLPSAASA